LFFAKNKTAYPFLIILSFLLVSTAIFAVDKRELPSAQKTNFGPRDISSQNEVNGFFKPSRWGNDDTIATGPVYKGISCDYDTSGNLYAVRCTTYVDSSNAMVRVYKSTNGGASWFYLCGFTSGGSFKYSYPVVLTGNVGNKLYVFHLRSTQNGDIRMARFTQSGTFEEFCSIKADADTITYFSACTDDGSHLMVAYQKEENAHKIYTITSTDSGVTWGNQTNIAGDGQHPDIAYGNNGYVYLVFESTTGVGLKKYVSDYEIIFCKNLNYGAPLSWRDVQALTDDSYDDHYPKVAALHTLPESTACVWVAYNHYAPPASKVTNIDLNFAYSTNSGKNWTKDQVIANDPSADEMAADLKAYRSSLNQYVDLCYLKYSGIVKSGSDICYTFTEADRPWQFFSPHHIINDHWTNCSPDGREVCQLTYPIYNGYPGIVYAGAPLKKDAGKNLDYGGWDLYYDYYSWVGVEEEAGEEKLPAEFSLSNNYPNPFNPETRIGYLIPKACQVKLEVFNILGQRVRMLVDENQTAGKREITWDGKDENRNEVASGVYLYRLEAESSTQTKKMVLIR